MILPILALLGVANAAVLPRNNGLKIVIGNDDGWATSNIRALYNSLSQAGYKSLISAPTDNKSGTSGFEFPPVPLITAGEFGTIPAGAPSTGADPNDPNIYYVNSFPATAIKYGIDTFAPKQLGGTPDLAVTGVNIGTNLGLINEFSGTVGAASKAISMGVPAIAFSAAGGSRQVYTTADPVADVYAQVATKLVNAVVASGAPYLPDGVGLNVNLPVANATQCASVDDYKFILSRVNFDIAPWTPDVSQCGSTSLPTESTVLDSGECYVSVSAFKASTKLDVDASTQKQVRDKISGLLSCM